MRDDEQIEPVIPPPRRYYPPRTPGGLRDVDAGDRMMRRKAAVWAGIIGLIGIPISILLAEKAAAQPPVRYLFLLGGPFAGWMVYLISTRLAAGGASVMSRIHNPRGDSTPAIREYSQPQALVARGKYREAIEVFEDFVTLYPEDPEPCIRIARIHRDKLKDYNLALTWFKRARSTAGVDAGREIVITQEIIEIFCNKFDEPQRAIPELARLIDRYPEHPSTENARRDLERLRRLVLEQPGERDH